MNRSLEDKLVLITGGSSGVGLKTAEMALTAGAKVTITGSNQEKLIAAKEHLDSDRVFVAAGDVRDSTSASEIISAAANEFEQAVEILINNAGTIHRSALHETSDEDWQSVLDINVNGIFYYCRAFLKQDVQNGAIVNVSSTCGSVGAANLVAYCASKGAVDQITRALALEVADKKITVNAVAPGAIDSPMLYSKHTDGSKNQDVVQRNLDSIPLSELASTGDVAQAILFLASQSHITGSILAVDGGYTAQ